MCETPVRERAISDDVKKRAEATAYYSLLYLSAIIKPHDINNMNEPSIVTGFARHFARHFARRRL